MAQAGQTAKRVESKFRLDIQVLRAIAVGAVLLYHLWPLRFTGGYVGVDIFFVISGFLITSHLLTQAVSPKRISLTKFWANRARRLLPMACVVLIATTVGIALWMPPSAYAAAFRGVIASTLYVQNWNLAGESIDYLARDTIVGPTQQFWSLSVEEQFCIVWPVLLVATTALALWVASKRSRSVRASFIADETQSLEKRLIRRYAFIVLALVFVVSLSYSLWLTETTPSLAYFATTTRAWEFAAGALLAFAPTFSASAATRPWLTQLRVVASWAGFIILALTIVFLPTGVPFPGVAALLPVLGTVLFMWAGDLKVAYAPTVLTRVRPIPYVGDISYSVYLWHWPLIVIAPFALNSELTALHKVGIVVVTIGLAAASKVFVEDKFRFAKVWTAKPWRGFIPAGAGMAMAVSAALIATVVLVPAVPPAGVAASVAPIEDPQVTTDPSLPLTPAVAARVQDNAGMYDCFDFVNQGMIRCDYGDENAEISIALIGDSHAAHLIPGLLDVVKERGWRLSTFVGMNCEIALTQFCAGGEDTLEAVSSGEFDLVLAGALRKPAETIPDVQEYFQALVDRGVPLVPIVDVPHNPESAYACIDASGGDPVLANKCSISRADGLEKIPDRSSVVAQNLGLPTIDLTDLFCTEKQCQSVIGNVIVYQDSPSSHLTATASRAIGPELGAAIEAQLQAKGLIP